MTDLSIERSRDGFERGTALSGFASLREAVRTLPIPGAPPQLSRNGAAVGLEFLDIVLRLNHVRRVTERLSVVEHRAATKTTELDVGLGLLDARQRRAAVDFSRRIVGTGRAGTDENRHDPVWVPVARLPRTSFTPVSVTDAQGTTLPRLTTAESAGLIASGLYRLLRATLETHPDAGELHDAQLRQVLHSVHEPRWLVQSAILSLLNDQDWPNRETSSDLTPNTVRGLGARYRSMALDVLDRYESFLRSWFDLFSITMSDFILIVALDPSIDQHILTFDSPLRAESSHRPNAVRRAYRGNQRGFYAEYTSRIPANLRAYYLEVETEAGLNIERMYLASNAERETADIVKDDLRYVAEKLDAGASSPISDGRRKILELRTQTACQQLGEILRKRDWQAQACGFDLRNRLLANCRALEHAAVSGEAVVRGKGEVDNSILGHPNVGPAVLRRAADEIEQQELHWGLTLDTDPSTARAHSHWHSARPHDDRSFVDIRAGLMIRDSSAGGSAGVAPFGIGLAVLAYVVGAFIARSPALWSPSVEPAIEAFRQPDAIAAVLLLLPGFLYTRLAIPDRFSISGQLRSLSRMVAQTCIGIMAVLAAGIAALPAPGIRILIIVAVLALLAVSLVLLVRRRLDDTSVALALMRAPAWAGRTGGRFRRFPGRPDLLLYSSPDSPDES